MPLVRSIGNIPVEVDRDTKIFPIDQEAGGDAQTPANSIRRPMTRLQARREAIEQENVEENIRHRVENSLEGFRSEMTNMIAESFRNLSLTNREPVVGQERLVLTEQETSRRTERDSRDDGRETLRHHHNGRDNSEDRHLNTNFDRNSDRVLNKIRNWKVRFTGDSGDFGLLCEHVHILFEGKAW
ncbi:hypothetical protein FF38_03563 [Lucilia cuprina]|uniref:Uncharacterized protein n=1 Tax=Lucilia cuprina TaxID=7375 RepID=A0A0L0C658_LUCCU|nr:hypothetical protein FF38_03563 [Lucilia cuprina]